MPYVKQTTKCECGCEVVISYIDKHRLTPKHIRTMETIEQRAVDLPAPLLPVETPTLPKPKKEFIYSFNAKYEWNTFEKNGIISALDKVLSSTDKLEIDKYDEVWVTKPTHSSEDDPAHFNIVLACKSKQIKSATMHCYWNDDMKQIKQITTMSIFYF